MAVFIDEFSRNIRAAKVNEDQEEEYQIVVHEEVCLLIVLQSNRNMNTELN